MRDSLQEITLEELTIITKNFKLVQIFYVKTTIWNMGKTSMVWDLNYEDESLEKANFLYYQDALKLHLKRKGRRNT